MPKANTTGKILEKFVRRILLEEGYEQVKPASTFLAARLMEQPLFAEQFEVGKTVYGGKRKADFILYHPTKWPDNLVIECKWQASSGSVEEKFPYLALNINESFYKTIVILDGGGYTKGAERWLREQTGSGNVLHVFDQGEFQRYVSGGNI